MTKRISYVLLTLLVMSGLAYATAPLFHWLWFGTFYRHATGITLFFGVIILTAMVAKKTITSEEVQSWSSRGPSVEYSRLGPTIAVGVVGVVLLMAYGIYASSLGQARLIDSLDYAEQDLLAQPNTSQSRLLPFSVAETYSRIRQQDPKYQLGDMDPIQLESGEMAFVAPLTPSGKTRVFTGQTDGFVIIHEDGTVETVRQPMKYGEGMQLRDSLNWVLSRQNYWVETSEVYYLQIDGQIVAIAPYISYDYQFPVQVPVWGGVFLIHADGKIEDLSPEEAKADSRLTGQHIFPLELAKKISSAWKYEGGIWNTWFRHKDQAEVAPLDNSSNQYPFLIPTDQGEVWFTAFKPRGDKAQGLFKTLQIDAFTGSITLYQAEAGSSYFGANQADQFVINRIDGNWLSLNATSGTDIVVEPRPVVRNGEFYWMYSVTTQRYAGVDFTVLVNARNENDIRRFNTFAEANAFLQGADTGQVGITSSSEPVPSVPQGDYNSLSDAELLDIITAATDELKRREDD